MGWGDVRRRMCQRQFDRFFDLLQTYKHVCVCGVCVCGVCVCGVCVWGGRIQKGGVVIKRWSGVEEQLEDKKL